MGCKAAALERALWGDYAYQPKTKRIVRIKQDQYGRAKPLFVQLALEPLWKVRWGRCLRVGCALSERWQVRGVFIGSI